MNWIFPLSHWCDTSCTCSWVYMHIVFAWEIKSISFSFHIIIIIIPSMPSTTYSPTIYMCVLSHILINFIFKLIMCLCVYANKINWIFSLYAESSEILYGETFYIFICGICYHSSHPFCSVQQDFLEFALSCGMRLFSSQSASRGYCTKFIKNSNRGN